MSESAKYKNELLDLTGLRAKGFDLVSCRINEENPIKVQEALRKMATYVTPMDDHELASEYYERMVKDKIARLNLMLK